MGIINANGDDMLLKDLMDLTNINISLEENAQKIEVSDDFQNNPNVHINDNEITIICSVEEVTRAINFNFDKSTITEIFKSELVSTGGTVYSLNGNIVQIIN